MRAWNSSRPLQKRTDNFIVRKMPFPLSDHCNGKTFFNPGERSERGLLDLLRWKFTAHRGFWPKWVGPASGPAARGARAR
jgi:hypothetical protein